MKNEVTQEMLRALNDELEAFSLAKQPKQVAIARPVLASKPLHLTPSKANVPETEVEISKLKSALAVLSPDVLRGQGKLYEPGQVIASENYWLVVIWTIASLGWSCGEKIAREWSMQSNRYTDDGFDKAWDEYDSNRPNAIGIGSLYRLALNHGWQIPVANANISPAIPDTNRYKILWPSDIATIQPIQWRLKHVLPATGLAAIFGPSGSGKTFLTTDLGVAISQGNTWFGIRTYQAPVIYVMLEGEGAIKNRVHAIEKVHGPLPAKGFGVITQSFQLTRTQDVVDLAEVVPTGSVVFIDTLNRAAPTSDENSSREMGEILEAAKTLYRATNSLVILVHHTGKEVSRGIRGHSSLVAALDGAIEVQRNDQNRSWTLAKSKDGEDGKTFNFKLKHHVLGQDADGEDITSCSIEPDYSAVFVTKEPSGSQQKKALSALRKALAVSKDFGVSGSGPSTPCIKVGDAVTSISVGLTTTPKNKRNNRAKTLIDDLIKGGYLGTGLDVSDEGWVWKI
jgi:hypothetical protein